MMQFLAEPNPPRTTYYLLQYLLPATYYLIPKPTTVPTTYYCTCYYSTRITRTSTYYLLPTNICYLILTGDTVGR